MIEIVRDVICQVRDQQFEQAFKACLCVEGITSPCSISLTLTDDERIREANKTWRNKDLPTDVLSFPSCDVSPGHLFQDSPAFIRESWDSDSASCFLGDIIINVKRAQEQAQEYGNSVFREMSYLFVHGVFHLIGYDHLSKEDQSAMRKQEEAALKFAFKDETLDAALLQSARDARKMAYVPYSNYRVGAALFCEDGTVLTGCNVENASFGLTNCAERTAIFKAISQGQKKFTTIAIAADQTAPWPCGACRQVMAEFAPTLRVLVTWGDGQVEETTLDRLLPHSFFSFQEDAHDTKH